MVDIKRNIKYKKEQIIVLNKLLEILNYNNDYIFYLYDLDNNINLQNTILDLTNEIKEYYPSSKCNGINGKKCKRPYLSIIKFLLKIHNKELYRMDHIIKINNKNIRTIKYKII